jgi:quercetin dioxygenase-like cupin family protein
METEKELNVKIINTIMLIQKNYPELAKYIDEMPITIPNENHPHVNIKNLKDYFDSLSNVLHDYMLTHESHISPSKPRPDTDRPLDAPALNFDIDTAIEKIKREEDWKLGKHSSIALLKSENMRIVLVAMPSGSEMKAHQAKGQISVQVLEGKINFLVESNSTILPKNHLLTLHENITHSVTAIENSVFLLTMVIK